MHINGKLYAACSPGVHNSTHDSSAQGSQFCLWPDPVNPRNCGPPSDVAVQYSSTLLMRQVFPTLGEVFWQSAEFPTLFESVTKELKIKNILQMDDETQRDIMGLSATSQQVPCQSSNITGTLKCEACAGGCQIWNHIDFGLKMSNERTHWLVPGGAADVIAYRSNDHFLWATVRRGSTSQADWPPIERTNIPNDNSNLNGGSLPDGRVYLVHNPVTPKKQTAAHGMGLTLGLGGDHPSGRDPVTLATSKDGFNFDSVGVAMTCTNLTSVSGGVHTTNCKPRYEGRSKNAGPSYPQALSVVAPAPEEHRGFYVAASNNKEDIWITKLDYGSF